jgi:hypothetical protein
MFCKLFSVTTAQAFPLDDMEEIPSFIVREFKPVVITEKTDKPSR